METLLLKRFHYVSTLLQSVSKNVQFTKKKCLFDVRLSWSVPKDKTSTNISSKLSSIDSMILSKIRSPSYIQTENFANYYISCTTPYNLHLHHIHPNTISPLFHLRTPDHHPLLTNNLLTKSNNTYC